MDPIAVRTEQTSSVRDARERDSIEEARAQRLTDEQRLTERQNESRGLPILAARAGPAPLPTLGTDVSAEDAVRDALGTRSRISGIANLFEASADAKADRNDADRLENPLPAAETLGEVEQRSPLAQSREISFERDGPESAMVSPPDAAAFLAELRAQREIDQLAVREVRAELLRGIEAPIARDAAVATAPAAGGFDREAESRTDVADARDRESRGTEAVREALTRSGVVEATDRGDLAPQLSAETDPRRSHSG